jgi:MFS family permease
MVSVVRNVGEGQPPKPRGGKSWAQIARQAWATDILKERSYVYLVASRLFFLMGGGILVNLALVYLEFTHRLGQAAANQLYLAMLAVVIVANVIAIVPAARASDRLGRKPVIYTACAIGAVGVTIVAFAPNTDIALVGAALFGASAGMFLSVDWALMTDLIPKADAGRYMGLSNVATGASTPLSVAVGGLIIDAVNTTTGTLELGPRVAFITGVALYGVAVLLFRPVKEPPRAERRVPA